MTGTMKFNKIKVRERTDWEEELQKSWAEIKISNDFLFGKLMRKNPGLCKKLLQRILPDLEIKRIQMVETQLADTKELPRRSRYYQGMIDMNLLDKSVAYRYLNDTYIIFICPFYLYGMWLHKYTFEGRCKEAPDLKIGDGATRIFLNAKGTRNDVSSSLRAFLDYVAGKISDDPFVQEVEQAVAEARKNREWRHEYMTLMLRDQENLAKGEERMVKLAQILTSAKKYRELERTLTDRAYRQELFRKYNL